MKILQATAVAMLLASPAFAGGMAEPVMAPEPMVEETTQGSRAGILVPILAIILIALAMSNGDDTANGATIATE